MYGIKWWHCCWKCYRAVRVHSLCLRVEVKNTSEFQVLQASSFNLGIEAFHNLFFFHKNVQRTGIFICKRKGGRQKGKSLLGKSVCSWFPRIVLEHWKRVELSGHSVFSRLRLAVSGEGRGPFVVRGKEVPLVHTRHWCAKGKCGTFPDTLVSIRTYTYSNR